MRALEQPPQQPSQPPIPGEVVVGEQQDQQPTESVPSPAKVMRIGAMVRQLLEEVRHAPLDEAGRDRMRDIYASPWCASCPTASRPTWPRSRSRVARPFTGEETPSEAELRVAQAQLVGWLEGLFHGIQATLFVQQMTARNQLAEGDAPPRLPGRPGSDPSGQYLTEAPLVASCIWISDVMKTVNATEVSRNFSEVLDGVEHRHHTYVVT